MSQPLLNPSREPMACDKLRQRAVGFLLDEFYCNFEGWPTHFLEPHITYIAVAFLQFDESSFSLKIGGEAWNDSVPASLRFTDVADILIIPERHLNA